MIGDLVRDDAQQFWEEYIPKMYPSIPSPPLSFGDVFAVLGGHMYHLEQYYFRGISPELTVDLPSWKCSTMKEAYSIQQWGRRLVKKQSMKWLRVISWSMNHYQLLSILVLRIQLAIPSSMHQHPEVGQTWPLANSSLIKWLVEALLKDFREYRCDFRTQRYWFSGGAPLSY